ncbi:MAG: AMP-binding protein, partial [Myxococcota bacterium]|nr:AMP-binding protein [Myxococcota bacterium]
MHFLEVYRQVVTQFPNRPAVWDNGVVLTHEEVWQQSLRICQCLHGDTIEVGSHIGLAISKSAELLVAILGVWMHGSVFVPLDPNLPMDRLIEYANQSNLALVLGGVNAEHFSCPVRFYA